MLKRKRWDSQRSPLPLIDHLFYAVAMVQSISTHARSAITRVQRELQPRARNSNSVQLKQRVSTTLTQKPSKSPRKDVHDEIVSTGTFAHC